MSEHLCKTELAGISIGIRSPFSVEVSAPFHPFATERKPDYLAELQLVDELPQPSGQRVSTQLSLDVFRNEAGAYERIFYDEMHGRVPSAFGRYDPLGHRVHIQCLRQYENTVNHTRGAFFHLGWEEILLREGRLLVHACLVDSPLGGILFSGPSGIGKSTQGELWCRNADSTVINGDRPPLWFQDGSWVACGSPYAGSSGYHVNRTVPVRALVLLRQAEGCSIRRMTPAEAFRGLWPGLTVSDWDAAQTQHAIELCEKAAAEIPAYALDCTPDERAVELLRRTLEVE